MVTPSSSSDYDYYYSSSSSEEDYKTSASKDRSKMDQSSKDSKKFMNGIYLDHSKASHDNFLKIKVEDEILADYRQERERLQRRKFAAEEKLRSRVDGVDSDSDASEDEPRKIKPNRRTKEIERLVEADREAEREKEEYWDMMYSDPDERLDFINGPNSDSEEESDENPSKDNNDDKSDNSEKSDDESDASDD
ncbi:glutamic acid-rich protein-like [Papaver somniferum]|uniref:glutamic acid-rich protein-like n=1 Tax=Papaver somniferum TaxID=3469 RepID=UPI000E6F89A2|nr:glutamic acid-rich protein-like [Papaver somniferum]